MHAAITDRILSWPVVATPSLSYSPETGWGFGAGGAGYFALPSDSLGRLSEVGFDGAWTLQRQWYINFTSTLYLTDRWQLRLRCNYRNYPDTYYGIGSADHDWETLYGTFADDTVEVPCSYLSRRFVFYAEPLYRIRGNWSIGALVDLRYEDEGVDRPWLMTAIGASVQYDSRDVIFYPSNGFFFKAQLQYVPLVWDFSGGTNLFTDSRESCSTARFTADFRQYFTIWRELLFAYQAYADVVCPSWGNNGTAGLSQVAPELLPTLGGQDLLRGFRSGRYRDDAAFAAQAELRFPIYSILRGTVFAGVGNTFNFSHWQWTTPKVGYGLGLRLCFNNAGLNIRADVARNNIDRSWSTLSAYSFYLTVKEAF